MSLKTQSFNALVNYIYMKSHSLSKFPYNYLWIHVEYKNKSLSFKIEKQLTLKQAKKLVKKELNEQRKIGQLVQKNLPSIYQDKWWERKSYLSSSANTTTAWSKKDHEWGDAILFNKNKTRKIVLCKHCGEMEACPTDTSPTDTSHCYGQKKRGYVYLDDAWD